VYHRLAFSHPWFPRGSPWQQLCCMMSSRPSTRIRWDGMKPARRLGASSLNVLLLLREKVQGIDQTRRHLGFWHQFILEQFRQQAIERDRVRALGRCRHGALFTYPSCGTDHQALCAVESKAVARAHVEHACHQILEGLPCPAAGLDCVAGPWPVPLPLMGNGLAPGGPSPDRGRPGETPPAITGGRTPV
jgi:hypothetical protein